LKAGHREFRQVYISFPMIDIWEIIGKTRPGLKNTWCQRWQRGNNVSHFRSRHKNTNSAGLFKCNLWLGPVGQLTKMEWWPLIDWFFSSRKYYLQLPGTANIKFLGSF